MMSSIALFLSATVLALGFSPDVPLWEWWSGASPVGPRWLAIALGMVELVIVAVGIVVALWPTDRVK